MMYAQKHPLSVNDVTYIRYEEEAARVAKMWLAAGLVLVAAAMFIACTRSHHHSSSVGVVL